MSNNIFSLDCLLRKRFRIRMNAIFDKDDDCCDQTWSYYAQNPLFKRREHAMNSINYDDKQNCCKKEEFGVYFDTTG